MVAKRILFEGSRVFTRGGDDTGTILSLQMVINLKDDIYSSAESVHINTKTTVERCQRIYSRSPGQWMDSQI